MNTPMNRLSVVAEDFVTSLSDKKKAELRNDFYNIMAASSWPWYKEVIDRYLKGPDAKALIGDIELHHPDGEFMNAIRENPNINAHEAEIILKEAKKILDKQFQ